MSSSRNYHSSEKPLCRYFASNICFKGEDCQFSHNRNALPDMVCKYYVQGTCSYGNRCRYDHIRPNREATKHNKALLNKTSSTQSSTSNKLLASLNTPNIVTKLSANSKSFVPVSSIKINNKNPWQNNVTTSLNNFHENLGQELELIGEQSSACSYLAPTQNSSLTELPICPYFEMGDCPNGDFCQFIHGLLCEMCGLNVLHPHNENQRKIHHRECLADHEEQMEKAFDEAKSAKMQCGICMEMIVEKGLRFGILQNCAHCYCLDCIRKWRKHTADEDIKTKTVRSCPECRIHSDYVIPSKIWIDGKAEKSKLVQVFKENTKKIQCKYIVGGNVDKCPFGNKCFYKHQMPGTIVEGKSPTILRKERRHTFDLFDFIFTSSNDDDDV